MPRRRRDRNRLGRSNYDELTWRHLTEDPLLNSNSPTLLQTQDLLASARYLNTTHWNTTTTPITQNILEQGLARRIDARPRFPDLMESPNHQFLTPEGRSVKIVRLDESSPSHYRNEERIAALFNTHDDGFFDDIERWDRNVWGGHGDVRRTWMAVTDDEVDTVRETKRVKILGALSYAARPPCYTILVVDAEYRRQGIASQLIDAWGTTSARRDNLTVWVSEPHDRVKEPGMAFLAATGFVEAEQGARGSVRFARRCSDPVNWD